jgi:electron transfer flavoprotein alpha subunit
MSVLLIAEVVNGELSMDATAKALTAAKSLGAVTILCAGSACQVAASEAAKLDGVSKVLCVSDDAYGHDLAEPMADMIVSLANDYSHIVAPSTAASKNIMPRAAAMLDVMIISEVVEVVDTETFVRPIYAGNALQTVKSTDSIKVMTIRTATFDAAGMGGSASIEEIASAGNSGLSEWRLLQLIALN